MRNNYLKIAKKNYAKVTLPNFLAGTNSSLDESVLPVTTAAESYNYEFSSGVLREGYGIEYSFINAGDVTNIWTFIRYNRSKLRREEILMYAVSSGEVYYYPDLYPEKNTDFCLQLEGVCLKQAPLAVNYRLYGEDVIILCTASDPMVVWDGENSAYTVEDSPLITSLALHYERLFVTVAGEKNAVWFSDDLDPTNWSTELSEGGFIEMIDERGCLNKVISYLNYIYIFRDYGISRLTAFAEQADFVVSNLFVSSGRIYPDTVCLCGDIVVFLAADGLYAFDGLSTRRVLSGLSGILLADEYAAACYHDGKYYLAAGVARGDETIGCESGACKNNGLIIFEPVTGSYSLSRGMDIKRLVSAAGQLFGITREGVPGTVSRCGTVFGEFYKKKWSVPKTDFSAPQDNKLVREMHIATEYDIEVRVITDTAVKTVKVKGRPGVQRVPLGVSGRRIGFEFNSYLSKAHISRPSFALARI